MGRCCGSANAASGGWSSTRGWRSRPKAGEPGPSSSIGYTAPPVLKVPSGAGPDRLLRGSPPQRGSTVFENSTACAPTIEDRSWCASRFDPLAAALRRSWRRTKSQVGAVPRHGLGATCIGPGPPAPAQASAGNSMTAFREVLHGEFDPGSGRTLAACLTHASGATNQGLPWGRAANG